VKGSRFRLAVAIAAALLALGSAADADYATRNAAGDAIYFRSAGAGTAADPIAPAATGTLTFPTSATITRPNTTPTYAAGQIVCASSCAAVSWTLTGIANGKARLTNFSMRAGPSVTVTTGASFRVHFDSAAPTLGAAADTSAYSTPWADRGISKGWYADCTNVVANSDNIGWTCSFPNGSFLDVPTDANGKLWGWLQAQGAYVGVANEVFQLDVTAQAMAN
jgi:hypothetical protein